MNKLIDVINANYKKSHQFNILQIGANDGVTNDHLYNFIIKNDKINAFLIEPIPVMFDKLKEEYNNCKNNLTFLNCAIFDKEKEVEMFKIDEKFHDEIKNNYNSQNPYGVTSIYKEHVSSFLLTRNPKYFKDKNVNDYISSFKIKGYTPKQIIDRFSINKISLLQIDVEGYDCKLLLNYFDTVKILPDIINFENKHSSKEDFLKVKKMLIDNSYVLFNHGGDTCAYKKRK